MQGGYIELIQTRSVVVAPDMCVIMSFSSIRNKTTPLTVYPSFEVSMKLGFLSSQTRTGNRFYLRSICDYPTELPSFMDYLLIKS